MGVDDMAVEDASIMPSLIGGNNNAPIMMIAKKTVYMILSEH